MKKDALHIDCIHVVLVDDQDSVLGFKEKYEAHHNPVPLHRAIAVVIYDKTGKKMLLQKRTAEKPTWPGIWSNATCTHPFPEESYQEAAERRLDEEMGIITPLTEKFVITYEAKYDTTWGEHEIDHIFVGTYDGEIDPNPQEVAEYKWMDVNDLKKDIAQNPASYTPWFMLIMQKLS